MHMLRRLTRLLPAALLVLALGALPAAAQQSGDRGDLDYKPDVSFRLVSGIAEGKMVFIGDGGAIDGVVNPDLHVPEGAVVQITLVSGLGATHDVALPDFDVKSQQVTEKGASTTIAFRVDGKGSFVYFCTLPGHRAAGMEGRLIVGAPVAEKEKGTAIYRDPADLPPPITRREPATVEVELEAVELDGQLADGSSYHYWTFNGKVPGPMVRVRVGDTVQLSLANGEDSRMTHSIDLHAVTGPGGGAAVMQAPPGQTRTFTFKARQPGLFVYHCATPMVAHHIANGMYGMILVEPADGLPPVDREFYLMQGEIYTQAPHGASGAQEFSVQKLLDERPEYYVFNGAVGALTAEAPLRAEVGDRVRLFFGVGGPNYTSSFHVIGEIFDRVYDQASLTSPPLTDVQTTMVPPGGATVVEFGLEVPGRYILVDHALSRLERGLAGFLFAEGEENPEVYRKGPAR